MGKRLGTVGPSVRWDRPERSKQSQGSRDGKRGAGGAGEDPGTQKVTGVKVLGDASGVPGWVSRPLPSFPATREGRRALPAPREFPGPSGCG